MTHHFRQGLHKVIETLVLDLEHLDLRPQSFDLHLHRWINPKRLVCYEPPGFEFHDLIR